MEEVGLKVKEDTAGNVIGRLKGKPAVMSGSKIDSVPNGGRFDGVLDVLTVLEVAEAWKDPHYQPVLK